MEIKKEQTIYQTIYLARKALKSVGLSKDGTFVTQSQKWNYRKIDDTYKLIADKLDDVGLILIPSVYAHKVENMSVRNADGRLSAQFRAEMVVDYTIAHIHNEQTLMARWAGEGLDTSDKATNKAGSNTFKYFVIQFFEIPIVGDEDTDAEDGVNKQESKQKVKPTLEALTELYNALSDKNKALYKKSYDEVLESKDAKRIAKAIDVLSKA